MGYTKLEKEVLHFYEGGEAVTCVKGLGAVGIQYPYVIDGGKKIRLTEKEWKELVWDILNF